MKNNPEAKPAWLKKRICLNNKNVSEVRALISNLKLHTVCQSAKCPNIFECFSKKTATFMLMGNICTRNCSFCGVVPGIPLKLDKDEPRNVANAAAALGLNYIVLTSVTRDDIIDGGASHFAETVRQIKRLLPSVKVECLIPDFKGNIDSIAIVLSANPDVLNHNMETVKQKYSLIRNTADYKRSLDVLKSVKKISPATITKSGFMVGLGESPGEIKQLLDDLKRAECDIVTIGQYLCPSANNCPVLKYYSPEEFAEIKNLADKLEFKHVVAGTFVRSSYQASLAFSKV